MLNKPPIGEPCNCCGLCCRLTVCGTGSYALGLVDRLGDRAVGPCPVLQVKDDGRQTCGLIERPRDYLPYASGGVHDLRRAVGILIGAGAGCDEIGDESPETADSKLKAIQDAYVSQIGEKTIHAAAEQILKRSRP